MTTPSPLAEGITALAQIDNCPEKRTYARDNEFPLRIGLALDVEAAHCIGMGGMRMEDLFPRPDNPRLP